MGKDVFVFKLIGKAFEQYSDNPEPSTNTHRFGMLKCRFPEHKQLLEEAERMTKRRVLK